MQFYCVIFSIAFDRYIHGDAVLWNVRKLVLLFAGAIFDENSEEAQIAFKYAVIRENMYDGKFELVPVIKTIQSTESSAAEKAGKLITWFDNFEYEEERKNLHHESIDKSDSHKI